MPGGAVGSGGSVRNTAAVGADGRAAKHTASVARLHAVKATTEQMLREALIELDELERLRAETLASVETLRRRYRDEKPGMFMLPTLAQLKREILR